ncbi:MAG: hypothetical protein RLZZ76_54 [Candidatus Parcubacteria bacterium]|jgi:hypothetical protein
MHKILILGLLTAISAPFFASAETVVRTGQNITVEAEQTVAGDYYVSVGPFSQTTMSGTVDGDMYAFGGVVTANGVIKNDLTVVGGSAQMHATVTDDVRIVAGEVTIADHVGGDLFVLGGVLNVLSTATIGGDVIFYGGTASIDGAVKGSVLGVAEKVRVNGVVEKNIDVKTTQSLVLGNTANVSGFVRYTSTDDLDRSVSAEVKGEVQKVVLPQVLSGGTKKLTLFSVLPLLIALFSTLVLFLFFRKVLEAVVLKAHKNVLKTGLVGLCALFGPLLSVLLMVTGLGFFIGVMTLSLLLFVFVLGYTLAGVVLGSFIAKWFTNHPRVTLPWVVFGTVLIQGLLLVPYVGIIVVMACTVVTIGSLMMVLGQNAIKG